VHSYKYWLFFTFSPLKMTKVFMTLAGIFFPSLGLWKGTNCLCICESVTCTSRNVFFIFKGPSQCLVVVWWFLKVQLKYSQGSCCCSLSPTPGCRDPRRTMNLGFHTSCKNLPCALFRVVEYVVGMPAWLGECTINSIHGINKELAN